jgi:hypothetical protein
VNHLCRQHGPRELRTCHHTADQGCVCRDHGQPLAECARYRACCQVDQPSRCAAFY